MTNWIEVTPPHDRHIEQCCLGMVMLGKNPEILPKLTPDLFYSDSHKQICDAILTTWQTKQSVDVFSVCDTLQKSGELEHVGGATYVSELVDLPPLNLSLNDKIIDYLENYRLQRVALEIRKLPLENDGRIDLEKIHEIINASRRSLTPPIVSMSEAMRQALIEVEEGTARVVEVGIRAFDQGVALARGDLLVIGARSSVGKTVAGVNLATGAALNKGGALIHTLEMSASRIAKRQLAYATEIENLKIQRGFLSASEKSILASAALSLAKLPIWFRHDPGTWLQHLASYEYALLEHPEINLLVVDYVQLISGVKADRRDLEIAAVTGALKQFALKHNIAVVALSQLNRKGAEGAPEMHQLRESGSIEQDADEVIILEAPEAKEKEERGEIGPEMLLAHIKKHRDGRTGTIELTYDRRYCKITDRDEKYEVIETADASFVADESDEIFADD